MKSDYEIQISSPNEEELRKNAWLMNVLQNKLKQVFMTPSLILTPGMPNDQATRILNIFQDPEHDVKKIIIIPGGIIELLVDNTYIIHLIFLKDSRKPQEGRISVSITQLEISPSANYDTTNIVSDIF